MLPAGDHIGVAVVEVLLAGDGVAVAVGHVLRPDRQALVEFLHDLQPALAVKALVSLQGGGGGQHAQQQAEDDRGGQCGFQQLHGTLSRNKDLRGTLSFYHASTDLQEPAACRGKVLRLAGRRGLCYTQTTE